MTEAWGLLEKASERAHFQAESVGICLGHMMNAIIDLESGETKARAIKTLQSGIALIDKRNAPMRELAESIRAQGIEARRRRDARRLDRRRKPGPEGMRP